jgi:hypothetical protein
VSAHVIEKLSAFLDGEMSEAERREVQEHLEACAACAEHLSELAVLDQAARGLMVEAPAGYFEALPGRIRQRLRGPRRTGIPVWGWAAAAALLVAVLTPLLRHDPFASRQAPAAAPRAGPPATLAGPQAAPAPAVLRKAEPVAKEAQEEKKSRAAAPARGAPEEVRERKDLDARDAAKAEAPRPAGAFAAAPPAATPAPPALQEQEAASADRLERDQPSAPSAAAPGLAAGGSMANARRKQAEEQPKADAAKRSVTGRLGTRSPRSAAEARALREEWRRRAGLDPEGPAADAARLGLVEAGVEAYKLSGDAQDLEILRRDAEAYLARRDAPHADRVRELLRAAEEP